MTGPGELRQALDNHIDACGELRGGLEMVELLTPQNPGLPIEDRTFYVAARGDLGDNADYVWAEVSPLVGVSETRLWFDDERAFFVKYTRLLWLLERGDSGFLAEDELQKIHQEVIDPTLEVRAEAIQRYYEVQHERRSRVGKIFARAFKTDRPRYA